MESVKSSSQEQQKQQKQAQTKMVSPSALASAAVVESGGARGSANASAADGGDNILPGPPARRSSHHYESDLAHHLRRASGEVPAADLQKRFHQRRESFNREDQKHAQYAYILGESEKQKEQQASQGFSES